MHVNSTDTIHVVIAINHEFVPHAAAMLASLLCNRNQDDHLMIHVMHNQLSERDKDRLRRLEKLADGFCQITYRKIRIEDHQDFVITGHLSIETYFRLQLPELFPELSRIIYLDVDLLVRTSLAQLWQMDLARNLIAAAGEDDNTARDYAELGMNPGQRFNAGLMVCDLDAMRKLRLWEAYQLAMTKFADHIYVNDQYLLNHVLAGQVLFLPLRWNHCSSIYRRPLEFAMYDQQDIVASIADPAILHFQGKRKPWQMQRDIHLYAHEYWRYLAMTSWKWNCWKGWLKKLFLTRKTSDDSTYKRLIDAGLLPGMKD
jgi:lipopolysaccharide biosynthesis glycosyltransferase